MLGRVLPVSAFVLLAVLLAAGLKLADRKANIPSPLLGKPVPAFALPKLYEPDVIVTPRDLRGTPYLVNFWGSWCVTCVVEHPVIEQLASRGLIRIIGFNFRDERNDAMTWLARHGDPYDLHLSDIDGRASIDFGVYAAPETFLVDPNGIVVYKHIGALTTEIIERDILSRLATMGADA